MKILNFKKNVPVWGIFLYLILISIGYLTTTDLSRTFIVPIRYLLVCLLLICVVALIGMSMIRWSQVFAVLIYLLLVFYGVLLSLLNYSFEIGSEGLILNVTVTVLGIFLLGVISEEIISRRVGLWYIVYILFGLILTIFVGGLTFSFPPEFKFNSEAIAQNGIEILYSQGMSKFFGVGLIFLCYLNLNNHGFKKISYICLSIIFIGLSFLGGGRGDSLAAIVIASFYIFLNSKNKFLFLIILFLSIILFYNFGYLFISNYDLLFIKRFSVIGEGDYGMRDLLALDVWNLLIDEPRCFIYGCGFGYFQKYYNYPFGMYPHNIILEFVVIFGFPIFLIFFVRVIMGVMAYRSQKKSTDLFLLLFIYLFVISLKSGNLFGDWFFTAALMMFVVGQAGGRYQVKILRSGHKKISKHLIEESKTIGDRK